MKRISATFAVSGLALLLSSLGQAVHADNFIDAPRALSSAPVLSSHAGSGAAGADISIHNLGKLADGRRVRLNGTVERMHGTHDFILHDETGRIDVKLSSALPVDLKKGSGVSVAGRINRGILGAMIEAQSVTLQRKLNHQVNNADTKPAKKADNAPAYSIQTLPETGIVKVSGVVTTSDNASQFVLKDATGLIDVTVERGNASNVLKGAKVTVIGPVDRGVLGKDISAQTIIVEKNAVMASAL